jgi:hypothetical protein
MLERLKRCFCSASTGTWRGIGGTSAAVARPDEFNSEFTRSGVLRVPENFDRHENRRGPD